MKNLALASQVARSKRERVPALKRLSVGPVTMDTLAFALKIAPSRAGRALRALAELGLAKQVTGPGKGAIWQITSQGQRVAADLAELGY